MTVQRFLKRVTLFVAISFIISVCFVVTFFAYNKVSFKDLPAPNLSNSYSFNEKMQFLHNKTKDIEILGVGSSMSLNNLNSKAIISRFHSDKYINASSWGLSFKDIYLLVKTLYKVYPLNTVIVASNMSDIHSKEKILRYDILEEYLKQDISNSFVYHLKLFDLSYYLTNFSYAKEVRSAANNYAYLGFDNYGGINFNKNNFIIDSNRWNLSIVNDTISKYTYSYLDSLSKFCKSQNLKLMLFESPIRAGIYSKLTQIDLGKLKSHSRKVEAILKKDRHVYINTDEVSWNDSLFIDPTHLSAEGSQSFMNYCFAKIDSIKMSHEVKVPRQSGF